MRRASGPGTVGSAAALAVAVALAACGRSERKPAAGSGAGSAAGPASAGLGAAAGLSGLPDNRLALPVDPTAGAGAGDRPAITPVATASITFAVPRADVTWMEMSFPCYAAGATMSSGADGHPGAPIAQVSPVVPVVMARAGIDLDKDLTAIGGFSAGERPVIYLAAHLATPERIGDGLRAIPGIEVRDHGGGHYSFTAPGDQGARKIDVRVVPVRWAGGRVADDPWSAAQLRTTHVIFLGGLMGGEPPADPLALVLDPAAGAAKVAGLEQVIDVARGRCMIGQIGPQADFKPGFAVERGRFVLAAPRGKGDALTRLLSSDRSLALELELTLAPAPTQADLDRWTGEARAWLANIVDPLRAQFAGQGPLVELVFDMMSVLGEHGYRSSISGRDLRLSWRTDRVPAAALAALERRYQSILGTP